MQTMTARRIILSVCLILAILALAVALLYTPPASTVLPASQEDPEAAPYTVRAYQGYVAVFTGNEETPSQITGIRVSLLPLQDQLELAEGISLQSEAALAALLEDYGA